MTGRTHDLAAVTALGAVLLFIVPVHGLTLGTALTALLANQIGGILPDIDQPTAPLWRLLPIGKFFGRGFDTLIGGHRFLTHSLLGGALFGLLGWWLLQAIHPLVPTIDMVIVWWAFMIGLVSHLLMDSFTKEGVPWLLPIPVKFGFPPMRRLRITTGKAVETWLLFPGLIVLDIWLCVSHYDALVALIHQQLH
jgi:inner membrane protein